MFYDLSLSTKDSYTSVAAVADTTQYSNMTVRSIRKHVLCVAESWNSGSKLSGCMLLSSPRFAFKGKHSPYYFYYLVLYFGRRKRTILLHTTTAVVRGTFTLVNFKTNKCLISTTYISINYIIPIYYLFINSLLYLLLLGTCLHSTSYKKAYMID